MDKDAVKHIKLVNYVNVGCESIHQVILLHLLLRISFFLPDFEWIPQALLFANTCLSLGLFENK